MKQPHTMGQSLDADLDKVVDYNVPAQYRGTETDKRDMLVHGKQQELRRNFRYASRRRMVAAVNQCADQNLRFLTMTGFSSVSDIDVCG